MIPDHGIIIEWDDDDDRQPECPCGGLLPQEPELERRRVGPPGQEFTEVREFRTCPSCGKRHEGMGWNED